MTKTETSSLQPLTVSLIQGNTRWHDAAANRAYYADLLRAADPGTDLFVLPETFLSGFSNDASGQAATMDGADVAWLAELAGELGAVITGSLLIRDGGRNVNRLFWMRPDGSFATSDKRHLFRMAGEDRHYAAGAERLIVELHGWRVLPLVCYDLRFPVWARNRAVPGAAGGMDYDLLLYVANWPAPRRQAWRTLLPARAIENQACCIGVNRTGRDGNGIHYVGDSVVHDARGETLLELGSSERSGTCVLDAEPMLTLRRDFPVWKDADPFTLDA